MHPTAVIAGRDPAIPIIGHGCAAMSGMAGSSQVKPGHDVLCEANVPEEARATLARRQQRLPGSKCDHFDLN
jgi:hypothetical protein